MLRAPTRNASSESGGVHKPSGESAAPAVVDGLQYIGLQVARCAEFPDGSPSHGYSFVAPLDSFGRLDAARWSELRELCVVRRFWGEEPDRLGHLVHRGGGSGGATWSFVYGRAKNPDDEETGYHLQDHRFVEGNYVSIHEDEGWRTFLVAHVRPAHIR